MHLFSFTCCRLTQDTRYNNFTDKFSLIKYLIIWVFLKYKAIAWSAFFCWCWGECVKMFTWRDLRREGEHFAAVSHPFYMVFIFSIFFQIFNRRWRGRKWQYVFMQCAKRRRRISKGFWTRTSHPDQSYDI